MTRKETIFRLAKGYMGRAKNVFKLAIRKVEKGLLESYRERRLKKRLARQNWIMQVGAGAREHGISYSLLIHGMLRAQIGVNRKMISLLAIDEPYSFRAIVQEAKLGLKRAVLSGDAPKSAAKAVADMEGMPGVPPPVDPTFMVPGHFERVRDWVAQNVAEATAKKEKKAKSRKSRA